MPSITIRERDLTSAGNLEITSNAVYIPGYSNMGPTNTPTMCETLQDFQLIFGSEPYKFRTTQPWPSKDPEEPNKPYFEDPDAVDSMGNFYEKGELEKSYIMAAELLKLGIPVLYERVFSTDPTVIGKWSAFTDIVAAKTTSASGGQTPSENDIIATVSTTSPGLASRNIYFTLLESPAIVGKKEDGKDDSRRYYTIKVGRYKDIALGISEIPLTITKFTFDNQVAALFTDCTMIYPGQTLKDNSGLVEIFFNKDIASNKDIILYSKDEKGKQKIFELSHKQEIETNLDSEDEFNVTTIYDELSKTGIDETTGEYKGLNKLLDKGEYVIKFITSGAYPTFGYGNNKITQSMIELAANRGDCTALIDHTPNNERDLIALKANSVYYRMAKQYATTYMVNNLGEDIFTYGAMFTPYGIYNCSSIGKQVMLPASFGYLSALAVSVQTNGNWMAAAGIQRGSVPNLVSLCQNLTNAIADSYQPRDGIAINPITNIKPYGLTIWGNRTLKNNARKGDLTATSFLSIRQLTNDVKRTIWVAAKTLTFEQNSDILWINFKSKIIPTLDQMISGSGLSFYEIKKQKTTKKATVKAIVRLYAIEPVEDWDITVELADSSTEIIG